jgi:hypothetical protein
MDIRNALEDIRDLLLVAVENGADYRVVRAYVLTENLLEQFFQTPDDVATLGPCCPVDEVVGELGDSLPAA